MCANAETLAGASNQQISLNITKTQDESHIYASATFESTHKSLKYLLKLHSSVICGSELLHSAKTRSFCSADEGELQREA